MDVLYCPKPQLTVVWWDQVLAKPRMSAQTSIAEKGLNPGLMCQESYACSGADEAVFECDECCSLQCLRCEEELHRQERRRNHERIRLKAGHVPYCDHCKGPNGHSPGGRQRAAVRCQACKINLCLECQKRTHSTSNKRRHPITVYLAGKAQESLEAEEMDEETKRKKMTEKVVSFLLVDENEEIQVSSWAQRDPQSWCCWEVIRRFAKAEKLRSAPMAHVGAPLPARLPADAHLGGQQVVALVH